MSIKYHKRIRKKFMFPDTIDIGRMEKLLKNNQYANSPIKEEEIKDKWKRRYLIYWRKNKNYPCNEIFNNIIELTFVPKRKYSLYN